MSIFGKIKDAIFGSAKAKGAAPASPAASSSAGSGATAGGASGGAARAAAPAAGTPAHAAVTAMSQVDVEAVLTQRAAQNKQKLDWRKSIVDLMKLLDLDSSLNARKELAKELNYTGETSDSAAMNVWLHRQVMTKVAANGGKVPADLKD